MLAALIELGGRRRLQSMSSSGPIQAIFVGFVSRERSNWSTRARQVIEVVHCRLEDFKRLRLLCFYLQCSC